MELDILRDRQDRGRFFWEMFPGAKASDERQRQRERTDERAARGRSSPAAIDDLGEKKADALAAK